MGRRMWIPPMRPPATARSNRSMNAECPLDTSSIAAGAVMRRRAHLRTTPFIVAARVLAVVAVIAGTTGAVQVAGAPTASAATVPTAPTLTATAAVPGGALVYFTPPSSDGGAPITNYEVCDWLDCATFAPLAPADITSPLYVPMIGTSSGYVKVRAVNSAGVGAPSNLLIGVPVLPPYPWAPTGVVAKPGHQSATVSFAPGSDNGQPVSNFQYSLDGGTWKSLSPADITSPVTVTGLTNGTTYRIRLRGVNAFGGGQPSAAVAVTPGPQVPAAPTKAVASPRNGAASVAFIGGAANGASITNFQYSLDGAAWRALVPADAASPVRIPGLRNGVRYAVRLRAVNAKGAGAASATVYVRPSTTPVPPGAPMSLTATPGTTGRAAALSFWPGSDGGATISTYQYSLNGGAWRSLSAPDGASPITVPGLNPGATYGIRIRAINAAGAGTSSTSTTVKMFSVPSAPRALVVKPADGGVRFTFAPPASNGGRPITSYQYSVDNSAWTSTPLALPNSPTTVSGLDNGTTYSVRVRAVNSVGIGAVVASDFVAAGAPPEPPTNVVATFGFGSVTLDFTPSGPGQGDAFGYLYTLDGGAQWTSASPISPTRVRIDGLVNGQTYTLQLCGSNAFGLGPASAPVTGTPHGPPAAPAIAPVELGLNSITIPFTAPADDGGTAVTNYAYSLDDGATWTAASPATTTSPLVVAGLEGGRSVTVRLAAINSDGRGDPSTGSSTVTVKSFDAPTSVRGVSYTSTTATFSFTPPADATGITEYQYSIDGGATWLHTNQAQSPLIVFGLTPGTFYSVRLRAVNALGGGSPSAVAVVRPGTPSPPLNVTASTGEAVISFFDPNDGFRPVFEYPGIASWTSPEATGGAPITMFFADWYNPATGQRITGCAAAPTTFTCQSEANFLRGTQTLLIVTAINGNGLIGVGSPGVSWTP